MGFSTHCIIHSREVDVKKRAGLLIFPVKKRLNSSQEKLFSKEETLQFLRRNDSIPLKKRLDPNLKYGQCL
jgi:hypothetical protein